jgi:hypothetical protein
MAARPLGSIKSGVATRENFVAGSICDFLLLTTELRYQWREAESHQELASQVIKREEDDAR